VPNVHVEQVISRLHSAREQDLRFSVASAFGHLLGAEEAGVIASEAWRDEVDVAATERFVTERLDDVVVKWDGAFESLQRWFGERLIYEEALMFLTRRSSLESAGRFVDADRLERLAATDRGFSETLRTNPDAIAAARRAPGVAIVDRLPRHWWWRTDFPPEEGQSTGSRSIP